MFQAATKCEELLMRFSQVRFVLFAGSLLCVSLLWPVRDSAKSAAVAKRNDAPAYAPSYTKDGQLLMPAEYRTWIFLTSGIDMSYSQKAGAAGHSEFDNVFVNPAAFAGFQKTGMWPDKTVLVLEGRAAASKGSINQRGHFQGTDLTGIEVHVKDASRFPAQWAFFDFENAVSGKLFARPAACYTCHEQHAAVDTTFVQFYPTLIEIAKKHGTLREDKP